MLDEEGAHREQSHQLLAVLIDLIHGDIVLNNATCCSVADAVASAYEVPLRNIVEQDPELSGALRSALNVYLSKRDLRSVPEILSLSREAAERYRMVSESLRSNAVTSELGEEMLHDVLHLSKQIDFQRFEHLKTMMDSVVINLMRHAASEFQRGRDQGYQAVFWAPVLQFASSSSSAERKEEDQRGGGEEVERTQPAPLQSSPAIKLETRCEDSLPSGVDRSSAPVDVPQQPSFCGEKVSGLQMPAVHRQGSSSTRKPEAETKKKGNGVGKAHRLPGMPVSDVSSALARHATEGGSKPFISSEVSTRTYFLCPVSKRYKPLCTRGLFS